MDRRVKVIDKNTYEINVNDFYNILNEEKLDEFQKMNYVIHHFNMIGFQTDLDVENEPEGSFEVNFVGEELNKIRKFRYRYVKQFGILYVN